ncbi:MAG: TIGR00341 family protein [Candidatus Heimdallarchaeota archaeon]|nr:TIGR00341 family protein [Candidatus Heimdallarchaeota archaeon]MCK4254978.1 TIGR00341 family protein [Candidatus Heimdallarchaeota archaeon]
MKDVKIIIPVDKLDIVKELEDKLAIVFNVTIFDEISTLHTVVENQQTSILLEELKGLGVGTVFGNIIVTPVTLTISSDKKEVSVKGRGISTDEMIANIKGLALLNPTFIALIFLAGVLASFGLIYDNVIIIIASMIIAPLLAPIALTVLGTMTPKNIFSKKAILAEVVGLVIIIVIGLIVGVIFNWTNPEMMEASKQIDIRTNPGIGDIIFAIASGLAAGLFIIRGESTSIVGVAVAASLCPPAANVGVLLANVANPLFLQEALGSLILLVLNVISIYASCALIFWTAQSFVRGGSVSTRQFRKISKIYMIQIVMTFLILILIITFIILDNQFGWLEFNL